MKIEFDPRDRAKLTALRAELTSALEVVEFALSKLPQEPGANGTGQLEIAIPRSGGNGKTRGFGEIVKTFVDSIPSRTFISTDLYDAMLTRHQISRGAVKNWLDSAEGKSIRTVTKGQGRKPTTYEKI